MGISDRIESTIERWSTKWKERLKGWLSGTIGFGIEVFMDVLGKSYSKKLLPLIATMEKSGTIPPEFQPILDEIKNPTGEAAGAIGPAIGNMFVGGAFGRLVDAVLSSFSYQVLSKLQPYIVGPDLMISWYRRGKVDRETLIRAMRQHGFTDEAINILIELTEVRFPSDLVAPAWLRDKAKFEKYWDDVRGLGITEDRLELLKELAYRIPGVQDIIRYVVKEAYAPEIYKAFGQDQEYPAVAEKDAEKAGVRPDMLLKEWISHWDLPSVGNGYEMLHRGQITQDQLSLLLKARDIMPFWRDKLTAISWSLPTRIEVRMMAQLGLVDKAFIMKILEADGLAKEYRSTVADMNIVRGIRSDLQTRYTKKWLDSAGVKAEIDKSGLSPEIADRLYQWIVTNAKPERTAAEKDLTVAQICKAVKRGDIPWEDGIARLMLQGYDEEEADLIMTQSVEVVEAEPTTELNVRVDTIRRQRRQRLITRDEEIASLVDLGLDTGLATAYADNDDLRLVKETTGGA
jgi:hypothetical protein